MADLPDAAPCYQLLARMALIRRFEEEAGRQYQRARAGGFLHLGIGEEATIVGTTSVMRIEDFLIGTYRTHGHAIARGTEPKRVMAELFGKVDGTSGGRGGSMHIFDAENRFMGGYGIVGGHLPIAAGLGGASQCQGEEAGPRRPPCRSPPGSGSPPSTRAKRRSPSACSGMAPPTPATSARP